MCTSCYRGGMAVRRLLRRRGAPAGSESGGGGRAARALRSRSRPPRRSRPPWRRRSAARPRSPEGDRRRQPCPRQRPPAAARVASETVSTRWLSKRARSRSSVQRSSKRPRAGASTSISPSVSSREGSAIAATTPAVRGSSIAERATRRMPPGMPGPAAATSIGSSTFARAAMTTIVAAVASPISIPTPASASTNPAAAGRIRRAPSHGRKRRRASLKLGRCRRRRRRAPAHRARRPRPGRARPSPPARRSVPARLPRRGTEL